MWNEEFQKSRIIFPLKKDNKTIQTSKEWKHLPFYIAMGYIPILSSDTIRLFDKEVNTSKVGLFLIDFKREIADRYNFESINSKWFLESLGSFPIENVPDFEFIDFLTKFFNDSLFQINHIHFPLSATLIDYDDEEYPFITKVIPLEDWGDFREDLGDFLWTSISQLMVLSTIDSNNKYRNLYFRGVENGIGVEYTFEKINGNWKLIKLEDYST
jgi:hypothetical protein